MKKILIATVGVLAQVMALEPAAGADMRVKAPIYKAPPVDIDPWTGFYVGANVGYSWAKWDSTSLALIFPAGPVLGPRRARTSRVGSAVCKPAIIGAPTAAGS